MNNLDISKFDFVGHKISFTKTKTPKYVNHIDWVFEGVFELCQIYATASSEAGTSADSVAVAGASTVASVDAGVD